MQLVKLLEGGEYWPSNHIYKFDDHDNTLTPQIDFAVSPQL
jgi:hypothetical protein